MKTSLSFRLVCAAFAAGIFPASSFALSDAEAAAGRAIFKQYADAVVGVEMVVTLKITIGDRAQPPREQKREVNGTVISPTGLTVTDLGALDPRSSIAPSSGARIDEPEYKEVKLRLNDGTEIPAQVVLTDADLDLAFIAPDAPLPEGHRLTVVNLDDPAKAELLGNYYDISRAAKVQQRAPAVRLINIVGFIEKPRRFIIATDYSPSCPVFDPAGHVLGISLRHIANGLQTGLIILPAADVADIAKQAAAVKPTPKPAVDAPSAEAPAAEAPPAGKTP